MAFERIDSDLCSGCGIHVKSCPADFIRIDVEIRKDIIAYPEDCEICCWCIGEYSEDAVTVTPVDKSSPLTSWG